MQLYAVQIAGVHPLQCATVSDSKDRADTIAARIIERIPNLRGVVTVVKVDSFYPSHMTDADTAILNAMKESDNG